MSRLLLPPFLAAVLVAGCDSRQEEAQAAFARYQSAVVSGDLRQARRALGELVAADDSNADYWIELGKVSMQLSDYGAAYQAFQRAHELNRANVEVLAVMTQLALRSGNLELAEDHAKQLDLLQPNNPAVPLTKGYLALRRSDLAEADRQVAALLEVAPYDGTAKVLQARILMARNQHDQAIAILNDHVRQQPSDASSLRALASLYELKERWAEAAATLRTYMSWQPTDAQARVRLVEAELRSNQNEAAADLTLKGLATDGVDELLAPWVALGRQEVVADRLLRWAETAQPGRRIAVARFLSTTSRPDRVLALIAEDARPPVRASNVTVHALYGAALVQGGRNEEGLGRLNEVLALDSTSREALRARALLRSRMGKHREAIEDAQKLVSVDRDAAQGRILLARIFAAAGDADAARRTLWEAFHDIGADRAIYDALRPLVAKSDGVQAAQRLSQEFYDKRNQQMTRSFA
nr:tetratricopeptide repeat protein [uncultured Sphingomonas sp.]